MIVTLDTFELGINTNKYDIINVDGLGKADIRTSSFVFSGRSGGLVTDQFYGMRLVTITGKVRSPTCDDHVEDRQDLEEATPIDTVIPVYFTLFNGDTYVLYANVTGMNLEYLPGGKYSDFKIDLLAGDPLFYSTDGGLIQTATVNRVTQGGYITPYDLPVDWASGSSPTIVVNNGNEIAFPIITFYDSATNPSITNQTTGETFALNISMVDGDELVIDMANRTATLNGVNVIGNKTDDSIWWALQVGNNGIVLDSDSGSDNIYAELEWRNGRTSI